MSKSLITLLLGIFLTGPAWPQEETSGGDPEGPETTEAIPNDEAEDIVDPELDDSDLDEQTYEEDDDDFVPSQEIPADEPIPFPSNI